jgi:hypothetical protein
MAGLYRVALTCLASILLSIQIADNPPTMTTPPERIEEFFTEQDEHGYSVDTASSGGDLNNKEYVRDYLTPKLHKLLHQELQKAREETIEKHFTKIGMVHINAFCKLLKSHHSKGNDVMYAVRRTEQYPFIFETKADVAKEVEKYIQSDLDQPNK